MEGDGTGGRQIAPGAGEDAPNIRGCPIAVVRQRLDEDRDFDSIHPSLLRQSRLNQNYGLYEVIPGIYQVRGYDLSNMTLIEGKTGWIIVDPLTARETAEAALAFALEHLEKRPVVAMIFTHSHIDHFGGVLGVLAVGIFADGTAGQGWNDMGADSYLGVTGQGVSGFLPAPGLAPDWPGQVNAQLVGLAAIAGSGMTNEDLWALRQLVEGVGAKRLGAWPPTHAGPASTAPLERMPTWQRK